MCIPTGIIPADFTLTWPFPGRMMRAKSGSTLMVASNVSHSRIRGAIALAVIALLALVGGALWFHKFRKAAAPPMCIVPFADYPGHQLFSSFSPDGKRIAFAWDEGQQGHWHIYVQAIGAEKPLRLTAGPAPERTASWSPDGRYIAFCRDNEHDSGIYVVPAAGGPERKLRTLSPSMRGFAWLFETYGWSPDGKNLAYIDSRPTQESYGIFLVAVDNPQDIRPLTTPAGITSDAFPSYSPDGQTVAFTRYTPESGAGDIFLMRVAGGEPKRLTSDGGSYKELNWTPDGAYIICGSDRMGSRGRLWKVSIASGQGEPLPVGKGALRPSRSPARGTVWRTRDSILK